MVFDELIPKVMCIHTTLIIVCRRLRTVKKRETPRSLDLLRLLQEQKYCISLYYTISGKQSNQVRTMLRSRLPVIGLV